MSKFWFSITLITSCFIVLLFNFATPNLLREINKLNRQRTKLSLFYSTYMINLEKIIEDHTIPLPIRENARIQQEGIKILQAE